MISDGTSVMARTGTGSGVRHEGGLRFEDFEATFRSRKESFGCAVCKRRPCKLHRVSVSGSDGREIKSDTMWLCSKCARKWLRVQSRITHGGIDDSLRRLNAEAEAAPKGGAFAELATDRASDVYRDALDKIAKATKGPCLPKTEANVLLARIGDLAQRSLAGKRKVSMW